MGLPAVRRFSSRGLLIARCLSRISPPWRLCQPTLSSSYLGFGVSDLDTDVKELDEVIDRLLADATKNHKISLIGHSTSCQDIVRYLKKGRHRFKITSAVLQAPVSDREAMFNEHGADVIASARALGEKMCAAGDGDEIMPRTTPGVFGTPITASRYASLSGRCTADDMFSSDLIKSELEDKLDHLYRGPPVLWYFSGDDEYVPEAVKENYHGFARRLLSATGMESGSAFITSPYDNHVLGGFGPNASKAHPNDPQRHRSGEAVDFINGIRYPDEKGD